MQVSIVLVTQEFLRPPVHRSLACFVPSQVTGACSRMLPTLAINGHVAPEWPVSGGRLSIGRDRFGVGSCLRRCRYSGRLELAPAAPAQSRCHGGCFLDPGYSGFDEMRSKPRVPGAVCFRGERTGGIRRNLGAEHMALITFAQRAGPRPSSEPI
jgi:hypothetical protein